MNRLQHATSPYLLQHAHNPVEWYPWGEEALAKARAEDKPILISIGYAACHWCHVMEKQSFEDPQIAAVMNAHFVCIKVDREERPDLDQIYMDAVQAMKINGGWPLNVFLTPSQQPFYGGTYFPPDRWKVLLLRLQEAFGTRRQEIEEMAQDLTRHLNISDTERFAQNETTTSKADIEAMVNLLAQRFDFTQGGIDKAPKFVMPAIWHWLLRCVHCMPAATRAREMVDLTLNRVAAGGIYDHIGGGFARYSVDAEWHVPHFEKMLYDNAQLLALYAENWKLHRKATDRVVLEGIYQWLTADMLHPEGGCFSSIDADSEGEEGKFYRWTFAEWQAALGPDAGWMADYFQITPEGNWEHGYSIPHQVEDSAAFASRQGWSAEVLQQKVHQALAALRMVRNQRAAPAADRKVITGWNALMASALVQASQATGEARFLETAWRIVQFLQNHLQDEDRVFRSWLRHRSATEGFLEDYAFLIRAYLDLYESTFREEFLHKAAALTHTVQQQFLDPADGYFFFTSHRSEPLIARKKEIFDNVIPSSNAIMAENLYRLGTLLDNEAYRMRAVRNVNRLGDLIQREPVYLSQWAQLLTGLAGEAHLEVALVGPDAHAYRASLQQHFFPYAVFTGTTSQSQLPLLNERSPAASTTVHVCQQRTCQLPVHSLSEALEQMQRMRP